MRRVYSKSFSNLKTIHFLIWKRAELISQHAAICTESGCVGLAGAVASSTRDPEDFIIPPSLPLPALPRSLSLSRSLHAPFISSSPLHFFPLQLCFKCSVLHLLSPHVSLPLRVVFTSSVALSLIRFGRSRSSVVLSWSCAKRRNVRHQQKKTALMNFPIWFM